MLKAALAVRGLKNIATTRKTIGVKAPGFSYSIFFGTGSISICQGKDFALP